MKCQRCLSGEAIYHVYTEAMEMEVCATCASEARRLGIAIEVLDPAKEKPIEPIFMTGTQVGQTRSCLQSREN